MNTTRTIIAGAVVAAAATAGVVAMTGGASAGTPSVTRFAVRAQHGTESTVDLGRSGFSAGDQDLTVDRLTHNGHPAGYLTGSCTTVRAGRATADQLCEFVLRFGKGQITAAGTVRSGRRGPGTFALPILGGTGSYLGAAGQIAITATNGATIPITVSLTR
jgi:hypothetical protein